MASEDHHQQHRIVGSLENHVSGAQSQASHMQTHGFPSLRAGSPSAGTKASPSDARTTGSPSQAPLSAPSQTWLGPRQPQIPARSAPDLDGVASRLRRCERAPNRPWRWPQLQPPAVAGLERFEFSCVVCLLDYFCIFLSLPRLRLLYVHT